MLPAATGVREKRSTVCRLWRPLSRAVKSILARSLGPRDHLCASSSTSGHEDRHIAVTLKFFPGRRPRPSSRSSRWATRTCPRRTSAPKSGRSSSACASSPPGGAPAGPRPRPRPRRGRPTARSRRMSFFVDRFQTFRPLAYMKARMQKLHVSASRGRDDSNERSSQARAAAVGHDARAPRSRPRDRGGRAADRRSGGDGRGARGGPQGARALDPGVRPVPQDGDLGESSRRGPAFLFFLEKRARPSARSTACPSRTARRSSATCV